MAPAMAMAAAKAKAKRVVEEWVMGSCMVGCCMAD